MAGLITALVSGRDTVFVSQFRMPLLFGWELILRNGEYAVPECRVGGALKPPTTSTTPAVQGGEAPVTVTSANWHPSCAVDPAPFLQQLLWLLLAATLLSLGCYAVYFRGQHRAGSLGSETQDSHDFRSRLGFFNLLRLATGPAPSYRRSQSVGVTSEGAAQRARRHSVGSTRTRMDGIPRPRPIPSATSPQLDDCSSLPAPTSPAHLPVVQEIPSCQIRELRDASIQTEPVVHDGTTELEIEGWKAKLGDGRYKTILKVFNWLDSKMQIVNQHFPRPDPAQEMEVLSKDLITPRMLEINKSMTQKAEIGLAGLGKRLEKILKASEADLPAMCQTCGKGFTSHPGQWYDYEGQNEGRSETGEPFTRPKRGPRDPAKRAALAAEKKAAEEEASKWVSRDRCLCCLWAASFEMQTAPEGTVASAPPPPATTTTNTTPARAPVPPSTPGTAPPPPPASRPVAIPQSSATAAASPTGLSAVQSGSLRGIGGAPAFVPRGGRGGSRGRGRGGFRGGYGVW